MEHELEALSGAAVVNAQDIEELQCRQTDIERELAHLRDCVRTAFDHAGVDFERVAGFVTSRVPTLQVQVAESTTPTSINPHLRPSGPELSGYPATTAATARAEAKKFVAISLNKLRSHGCKNCRRLQELGESSHQPSRAGVAHLNTHLKQLGLLN